MEIKAFRAFRFNSAVVGDAGSCIAPPYDVINPTQQQQLYEKNEYNIVRIIKGKQKPDDAENDNQYTRAAGYLNDWIGKGALKQDAVDTIYGYVQDFEVAGNVVQRLSFIALAKLEEFGKIVRPHEQILKGPIVDRLNLERATGAKFGLVFMLYDDQKSIAGNIIEKAAADEALIDFIDEQDVRHRLFAINDEEDTNAITKMMSDKSCTIADGHHRYTTALAYAKENPNPAAQYQMLAFANTRHEGLVVLATHRIVNNIQNFDPKKLSTALTARFEVTTYKFESDQDKADAKQKMLSQIKQEQQLDKNAFGIYTGGNTFSVAVLSDKEAMETKVPQKSTAWRSLDVSVLHKLILKELLDIDEEKMAQGGFLEYVKDTPNAIDDSISQVDAGEKQVAFFMNPPKMQQIEKVADEGERMPQKSTYFYPKIFTGLTINKL